MENWKGYLAEADELSPELKAKMAEHFFDSMFGDPQAKEKAKAELERLITSLPPEHRGEATAALKDISKKLQQIDQDEQDRVAATTLGPEQPVLGPGDIEI